MNATDAGATATAADASLRRRELLALTMGAIGVVYGNIGTSPLYAMREAFHGPWAVAATPTNVLGVLSLMIWALVAVIAVKYLVVLLRADHQGQGGIIALLTILIPSGGSTRSRMLASITTISLFGAALLYGDGVITPSMSVLSAVEGLELSAPSLARYVIPITLAILIPLFLVQKRGTGRIGAVFGPIIVVWFAAIAAAGVFAIARQPRVLEAFNPVWALRLFGENGTLGLLVLSAVVLVVTGGEALYADLGHFGKTPIRLAGFLVALPALVLNYLGQGALLLTDPSAAAQPFFQLFPGWARNPMVLLATAATVVASQALITACYSLTQQLVHLGYIPRVRIIHTSHRVEGQIYVPQVNTFLLVACVIMVLVFQDSSAMAAAYGLAVVGTMLVTTVLFYFVAFRVWKWGSARALLLAGFFGAIELALLGANLLKLKHGAWIPLVVGLGLYTLMATWRRGRDLLTANLRSEAALPAESLVADCAARKLPRVAGTAVFMTRSPRGLPQVLLHHLKHNRVLHDRVILLTIDPEPLPVVAPDQRVEVVTLGEGLYRVILRHGFMEAPKIAAALSGLKVGEAPVELARTSFYLGRETILATGTSRMPRWRKQLFALMSRNAETATLFFGLPPNRVVELGTQVAL